MIQQAETWKPIPGFEGYYEASDLGRIRSLDRVCSMRDGRLNRRRGRILTPQLRGCQRSYLAVFLKVNGGKTAIYVHRAVLLAFVGLPGEGEEASHEPDPDTFNCRLDNLKWRTRQVNLLERDLRAKRLPWESIEQCLRRLEREDAEPGSFDQEAPAESVASDASACPF